MKDINTITTVTNVKSSMRELKEMQTTASNEMQTMLGVDKDKIEVILKNTSTLTNEDILKLSDEEIIKLFTIDGKEVTIDLDLSEDKKIEFLRDFIVYSRDIVKHDNDINIELDKMENILAEHDEDYKNLMKEQGCMFNIMRNNIIKLPDNNEGVAKLASSFEDVIGLVPIFEYIKEVKLKNILKDYTTKSRSLDVYKKYKQTTRLNHVKTDLVKLVHLGSILNKELNDFDNIVIFTIIRYFSTKTKYDKVTDVGFITILSLLYDGLLNDNIDEDTRSRFTEAHNRLVAKFTSL